MDVRWRVIVNLTCMTLFLHSIVASQYLEEENSVVWPSPRITALLSRVFLNMQKIAQYRILVEEHERRGNEGGG